MPFRRAWSQLAIFGWSSSLGPPSWLLIVAAAGCAWSDGLPPAARRPRAGATCRRRAEAPGRRGGITQPFHAGSLLMSFYLVTPSDVTCTGAEGAALGLLGQA